MRYTTQIGSSAFPLKSLMWRAFALIFLTTSIGLVILSRTGSPAGATVRGMFQDMLTPVLSVLSSPSKAMGNMGGWWHDIMSAREENRALKEERAQLLHWQSVARELEAENKALRSLLNFNPPNAVGYVTARVVGQTGGPYSRSLLINAGRNQGVKQDQAVINDAGLVGRVMEAGSNSARVLLVSDLNSRIPVVAENSRTRAILAGLNEDMPELRFVEKNQSIDVGELLVTGADGHVFPAGIPVGKVFSNQKQDVRVRSVVDWREVDYVRVMDVGSLDEPSPEPATAAPAALPK